MTTIDSPDIFYSYWYHPESDCVVAIDKAKLDNISFGAEALDELTVDEYLAKVTEAKQLPPGVRGILKNAQVWPMALKKDVIIGDLYFDPKGQFPDGINITTSRIQDIRSDGLYKTLHSLYYVMWKPGAERIKVGA